MSRIQFNEMSAPGDSEESAVFSDDCLGTGDDEFRIFDAVDIRRSPDRLMPLRLYRRPVPRAFPGIISRIIIAVVGIADMKPRFQADINPCERRFHLSRDHFFEFRIARRDRIAFGDAFCHGAEKSPLQRIELLKDIVLVDGLSTGRLLIGEMIEIDVSPEGRSISEPRRSGGLSGHRQDSCRFCRGFCPASVLPEAAPFPT